MTSENKKSHGSLILRIGAIFFGLGTLIYTGLEFLTFFEIPQTCFSWAILFGANPILYMIFVFMQMYYIFMHSRININKNKVITLDFLVNALLAYLFLKNFSYLLAY